MRFFEEELEYLSFILIHCQQVLKYGECLLLQSKKMNFHLNENTYYYRILMSNLKKAIYGAWGSCEPLVSAPSKSEVLSSIPFPGLSRRRFDTYLHSEQEIKRKLRFALSGNWNKAGNKGDDQVVGSISSSYLGFLTSISWSFYFRKR